MNIQNLKAKVAACLILAVFTLSAEADQSNKDAGWHSLFNGKDLAGWEFRGGSDLPPTFAVEDGAIVGRTLIPRNNTAFVCTTKQYKDFELVFDCKIDPGLNSGVQIRSEPEGTVRGA